MRLDWKLRDVYDASTSRANQIPITRVGPRGRIEGFSVIFPKGAKPIGDVTFIRAASR